MTMAEVHWDAVFARVQKHFRGDAFLATKWMLTWCPAAVINAGRGEQLLRWVNEQMEANRCR